MGHVGLNIESNSDRRGPRSSPRTKNSFVEPEERIPERFTTRPELVLNKDVFVPWSTGKMACLGKHLSLLETRVATVLQIRP
ncbi:hypothetical protein GGS21DRAFT_488993 [Xylaria nigripes]|nr:hypothetical protein GGS21DRAFT_488993 [Xylaria nigripes]